MGHQEVKITSFFPDEITKFQSYEDSAYKIFSFNKFKKIHVQVTKTIYVCNNIMSLEEDTMIS